MFSGCTVLPGSDQDASALASKNTRVVLVPCHTWKCAPTAISGGVDISEVPGCPKSFVTTNEFSGSQKLLQGFVCHEHTVCLSVFLPIFNSMTSGHIMKRM